MKYLRVLLSLFLGSCSLAAAFAQTAEPTAEDRALAEWVFSNQWLPCKGVFHDHATALNFGEEGFTYISGCNTCENYLRYDLAAHRFQNADPNTTAACTLLDCPDDHSPTYLHGLGKFALGSWVDYRREGDQLILTQGKTKVCLRPISK